MTFQAWKMVLLNSTTFQEEWSPCTHPDTNTYGTVSSSWQLYTGLLVLHVNQQAADLRQSVLEVVEVGEEVHYRVTDLAVNRLSVPHAHQRARVV